MARIALSAEKREQTNKSLMGILRRGGSVPGIVYHKGDKSVSIQVSGKSLTAVLHTDAGRNVLIDLKIKNEKPEKSRTVVVKELQHDPVRGDILHVDFHQISLTEKIMVNVPIIEKGEAVGVKNEGGILESPLRELHIECLPTDIPEHIEVDISGLKLNESIHVRDLKLPAAIKILNDPEMVIVQVKLPVVEEVAAPGTEEVKEPEVITEKKKEEGEAAPGEKGEKGAAKEAKPEKSEKAEPKK